jgi:excisionase family DNA binding protein
MMTHNTQRKPAAEAQVPAFLRELAEKLPLTLTLQEAADHMKMHPRSVQRLIAKGTIRASRANTKGPARLVIPRSEVLRWFAARVVRVS